MSWYQPFQYNTMSGGAYTGGYANPGYSGVYNAPPNVGAPNQGQPPMTAAEAFASQGTPLGPLDPNLPTTAAPTGSEWFKAPGSDQWTLQGIPDWAKPHKTNVISGFLGDWSGQSPTIPTTTTGASTPTTPATAPGLTGRSGESVVHPRVSAQATVPQSMSPRSSLLPQSNYSYPTSLQTLPPWSYSDYWKNLALI